MQLVVVMAVRKAVSAATITFTAISTIRFFICTLILKCHTDLTDLTDFQISQIFQISQMANPYGLVAVRIVLIATAALTGVDHQCRSLSGHREAAGVDTTLLSQFDA